MKKEIFGYLPSGEAVEMYLLKSDVASVEIITCGGAIRSFVAFGTSIVGGFAKRTAMRGKATMYR